MKDKISSHLKLGEGAGNILKAIVLAVSIISAGAIAYNKIGELERYSSNHYSLINKQEKEIIRLDGRVMVIETNDHRQDQLNEKMMVTLQVLNESIVRLNVTMDMLEKQK